MSSVLLSGTLLAVPETMESRVTDTASKLWGRGTLGRQLLGALLLIGLLPLAMSATLAYWRCAEMVEGYLSEGLGRTADAYAADLDLFLERQRVLLRSIPLEGQDPSSLLTQAASGDPTVSALLTLDSTGAITAQSTGALAPWAVDACRALTSQPGRVMTHAGEGHAHEVVIGVPRGEGLLCGQVSFTLHQEMLSRRATSMLGGSAYIIDRSGTVVCHAFEDDEPHVSRGDALAGGAAAVASRGEAWSGLLEAPSGASGHHGQADSSTDGPWLAAYAPASGMPWGVWVEVPREQAAAPLRQWLVHALSGALFIGMLALVLGIALARRLSRPLRDVVEAVHTIEAGEYGASVPVQGPAEVATLARDFNRMSEALAASYAELDARVRQRTEELSQARQFSDLLLDTMKERILVIDPDRTIVRANRAALEAYGSDIVGCGCTRVHHPGHDAQEPGVVCPTSRVLQTGEPESGERVRREGGEAEILAVDLYPLPGEDGRPRGVVEIARDITELRRMQARLMHQEKMASLGTLAAGLAHEIGNPLASMSSELELLERMWDPEEARASLPVLQDQVRRISGLLRELVEYGRAPTDEADVLDPALVVADVVRLLRHDPRARGVEILVDMEPDLGCLCTNRDRLVQVLVNLGLNALDALAGGGRLTFAARSDDLGGVRFEVVDDGPGVPEALSSQVFDPFFTTKPPGKGTGLGLFVSARIVQGLGGTLGLARPGDEGATFTVTLPACACPPSHETGEE